ncbi:hypothetical protein [Marinivivus vitaminiproducens]|uniref:hypothetical protein n=1 Tax=Marinivivus vitaminiproducens TaxID=3035935 RepID=UPI0027A33D28|nr:hypothetical protein P4R82_25020 [Geminicoccaceae bacterium SCSIO 64248]
MSELDISPFSDPEHFPNGRYWAEVEAGGLYDANAVIGYDDPMETYFFVSGAEWDDGTPAIWLGTLYRQFTSFAALRNHLAGGGMRIVDWELRAWRSEAERQAAR